MNDVFYKMNFSSKSYKCIQRFEFLFQINLNILNYNKQRKYYNIQQKIIFILIYLFYIIIFFKSHYYYFIKTPLLFLSKPHCFLSNPHLIRKLHEPQLDCTVPHFNSAPHILSKPRLPFGLHILLINIYVHCIVCFNSNIL